MFVDSVLWLFHFVNVSHVFFINRIFKIQKLTIYDAYLFL